MTPAPASVLLVTCADVPSLTADDQLLVQELARLGLGAVPAVWDDPSLDWSSAPLCVLRSVWDYHLRREEFLVWLERTSGVTTVENPPQLVAWNSHKSYLRDLADRGVPVVDTEWLRKGESGDLGELLRRRGWDDAILKPAVGASAYGTVRASRQDLSSAARHLRQLLDDGDALVQPYLGSVELHGETSLVFAAGALTHAVRRRSTLASGIEETRRGEATTASARQVEVAEAALDAVGAAPLYARVDRVETELGPTVLELELIEPVLYFRHCPEAARRLAGRIVGSIDGDVATKSPA